MTAGRCATPSHLAAAPTISLKEALGVQPHPPIVERRLGDPVDLSPRFLTVDNGREWLPQGEVAWSALGYRDHKRVKDAPAMARMRALSAEYPRYGIGASGFFSAAMVMK